MRDVTANVERESRFTYVELDAVGSDHALAELQHRLPDALAAETRAMLEDGERLVFSFAVDMNPLGRYAQEWAVLTDRRVAVWEEAEDGFECRAAVLLAELEEVRLRELMGNHILLVSDAGEWCELLRSSNMTAWKLRPLRQVLEQVVEKGPTVLHDVEQVEIKLPERRVCPKCGRVIRPRLGVCLACMSKRGTLLRMFRLLLHHRKLLVLVFLLLLCGGVLALVPPLISRSITDLGMVPAVGGNAPASSMWYAVAEPGSVRMLLVLGLAFLMLLIIPTALGAVQLYVMSFLAMRIVVDLSNATFSHMMRLSLSFYHREETGRAMSRITRDVARINRFLAMRVPRAVVEAITVVGIMVIMPVINWRLALLALTPVPILVGASEMARRRFHRLFHMLWRRYAAMSHFLADVIPGIRVVKAFAAGRREVDRFEGVMDRIFTNEMRAVRVRAVLEPVLSVATRMGGLLVLICGGIMVVHGRGAPEATTIGDITAFTAYMWMFYGPVQNLARMLPDMEQAATSAERVFEVLDSEPELAGEDRTVDMPPIKGRVEFRNVTFSYEAEKPVLKDINLTVEPGEMIGFVGHSGAGKTTLINLICHFYKTEEGQVLIDGQNLAEVRVETLRSQIGMVAQEPFLFSGTVGENIAYGKPGATELVVMAAARAANAHEFILDFPEGYDTLVGERGERVSGGERQRIAIARAILKDPRILILDEATSSVDTETEEKIQEALQRLVSGRTTFAIAHRLSTLKFANRLLVIERGRLVEQGTHDELMEMDGVYARLCRKQTELSSLTAWHEQAPDRGGPHGRPRHH